MYNNIYIRLALLPNLSDNHQNRTQINVVFVQQEKMDRVGFEPTTSRAQKSIPINFLPLYANGFVRLSSSLSFLFDNNREKMQKLSDFWLLDQKSLKDMRFHFEKTEHGYFLNH